MALRRGGEGDSKFLRLTGLWESKKKAGLWTGKFRNQDLEKLEEKIAEANDAGADLVFFLWENDKDGRKDPDFTVQVAVSNDEEGGRSRSRGRSSRGRDRDEDRDRDRDKDRDDKEEEEEQGDEEPEEREERTSRGKSSRKEKEEPRGKSRTKKDDNW